MANTRNTAGTAGQAILLLIARLVFAGLLLGRAWYRWQVEGMAGQVARLEQVAIPQAELIAWGTLVLEALGGALLALGLLTRVVAAFVLVQNVLVIALIKWPNGLWLNDGGFEYNAALAALGLVFLAVGASHASLDALFFGRRRRATATDTSGDLYQPKLGSTQV